MGILIVHAAPENKPLLGLVPTQPIVEMMRPMQTWLHPRGKWFSLKERDEAIRQTFSESFYSAIDIFFQSAKSIGEHEHILISEDWSTHIPFFEIIMKWLNPLSENKDEFYDELRSWFRQELKRSSIITNCVRIFMKDEKIVLSVRKTSAEKWAERVRENTKQAFEVVFA